MARRSISRCLAVGGAALALSAAAANVAYCQSQISLSEVQARTGPFFTPAHEGETVVVYGVVSSRAFHISEHSMLAIQSLSAGAVLRVAAGDPLLDAFQAGDEVECEGRITAVAGMPVVDAKRVSKVGDQPPPTPLDVPVRELLTYPNAARYLGRLVRTEARVIETGYNTGGVYLLIGTPSEAYKLFFPLSPTQGWSKNAKPGDRVSSAGVALQYCPRAPYNQFFELVGHGEQDLTVTEAGWELPPYALAGGLVVVLLVSFFLWSRERRLRSQRERLRKTYQLAEEIMSAPSAAGILKRISNALPTVLAVSRARLFVYNRAAKSLDEVVEEGAPSVPFSLEGPPGGAHGGAAACFHYRTLLAIPDISKSPFPIARESGEPAPRAALYVPLMAQSEVMGVLELDQDDHAREFSGDEQALAQHVGNQIGVAIRLMGQRSVQEQLFRTEKLAAVGRLISGIVDELQSPLTSISELAERGLKNEGAGAGGRELSAIASEAQRAGGMVARLMAFGGAEHASSRPVCITTLLRNLIEFREPEWKASGIHVEDLTAREPLEVAGSQGQLEQVFLNLLVHAEQSLADSAEKNITIRTSVLGRRVTVEIGFTSVGGPWPIEETASALGVSRSIVAGHGGEVRLIVNDGQPPKFEVELPLAGERPRPERAVRGSLRPMTILVIEPDEVVRRQLVTLLAARNCRVIPVESSDSGLEMAQRLRFDAAFCSVHAPGLNWVELSERMHPRVAGFVLLSDHYDAELRADFEGEGRFVLPKPLQEEQLEQVLYLIGS